MKGETTPKPFPTAEYMCDFVDAHDSKWYYDWCERDGTYKELITHYLTLRRNWLRKQATPTKPSN